MKQESKKHASACVSIRQHTSAHVSMRYTQASTPANEARKQESKKTSTLASPELFGGFVTLFHCETE
jgi:hypothetical protein